MLKTLAWAALASCIALTNAAAFGQNAPQNEPEEQKDREAILRPLAPTPADLEPFNLRPTDSDSVARGADFQPEGGSPLFEISGLGMFAASGADFATTEIGLARGLGEANPVASNRSVRLVHHVIGPAAVWWTTAELQKNGKTKLATALRIALMGAYGYATLHNLRQVGSVP
jgi:hypothetical protein